MFVYFIAFFLSFVLALVLFPSAFSLASTMGLVDHPNQDRKTHKASTPVVGGVLIGFVVLIVFTLLTVITTTGSPFYSLVLSLFALFVFLGAIDDRIDISAKHKFFVQVLCAILVVRSGVSLNSINFIIGYELPAWIIDSFTVLLIVGALNAYNLVDGIDGLLGGFLVIGYAWLLMMASLLGEREMVWLLLSVLASLVVFLRYNLSSKKKVFMGDAGALSLGFLLIVLSIILFEKTNTPANDINWMSMGIICFLSVPVLDTAIVFSRRLNKLSSPFKADRTHLHHLVLDLKISHKHATGIILGFSLVLLIFSLMLFLIGFTKLAFFILPVVIVVFYYFINKIQLYLKSQGIIQALEKK